jgi:hypothetical protein
MGIVAHSTVSGPRPATGNQRSCYRKSRASIAHLSSSCILTWHSFIAVPGINSRDSSSDRNAFDTFTAYKDGGDGRRNTNWLQDYDFLPKTVPHSRVLLHSYDAAATFGPSLVGIWQRAQELLNLLLHARRRDPCRPVIFIVHSLGGLIVKAALLAASKNPKFSSIKEATRGICFFGTPHRGNEEDTSLESLIANVCQRLFLATHSLKSTLHQLTSSCNRVTPYSNPSHNLSNPRLEASYSGRLHVVSFYENVGFVSRTTKFVLCM